MPLLNEMARQRASIYRWFAQILYQELTEEALIHMRDDDTQARLRALKSIPELWLDVQQFQLRLRTALKRKDRQLELAADFASLFLIPPPAGVSPYAGHYPHTTSHEARKIMQQWLVGYELAPQNNEAPRSSRHPARADGSSDNKKQRYGRRIRTTEPIPKTTSFKLVTLFFSTLRPA